MKALCASALLAYNPRVAKLIEVHPRNPQPHRVQKIVERIRDGALIAYPTDSSYAFGCHIGDKKPIERIHRIRRTDKKHNFTLVCADLSEISVYARVDNWAYRLIKSLTPGPYTFILRATAIVPRRLQHPKQKTIGIRVTDNLILEHLLAEYDQPVMSSTLIMPGNDFPETDAHDIREKLEHQLDLVVDGGHCGVEPTTIVDLTDSVPRVVRKGRGATDDLE